MRVIAGIYKGLLLVEPSGHKTHPMGERIRGALFNTLGDIQDLTMLDACAGSGAVSIEAVSRGATHVDAVEIDYAAFTVLERNIKTINKHVISAHRANTASWLTHTKNMYDIVIVDPPYQEVKKTLLDACAAHVKPGGIYVLSAPTGYAYSQNLLTLIKTKHYGDATLYFYKREK